MGEAKLEQRGKQRYATRLKSTECYRLFHRPAAVGHFWSTRQSARPDPQLRSDGTTWNACPPIFYMSTCLRARSLMFTNGIICDAHQDASETVSLYRPTSRPLRHHFGEAGYATGYIGKWHLYSGGTGPGPVPAEHRGGYDYWLASNVLEFTSDAYQTTLYDNDNKPVDLPGYRVDALTDAVIRYVDRHQNEPFYLFTSYIEPHHQNHLDDYPPPDGYRERYAGKWIPPDLAALGGSTHQHLGGLLRHGEKTG